MSNTSRRGCSLLDVNVLVALAWPNHVHHVAARRWFSENHRDGWATTPFTEAGFVRVSSNRSAIPTATTPALARQLLSDMIALPGHQFWPDEVSLVVDGGYDVDLICTHREVTDAHLLMLANRHDARLVTFDGRMRRLLGALDTGLLDVQ